MTNQAAGTDQYEKFYAYLNDLLMNYTKLSSLLAQKLEAVAKFDVQALDNILKEEQVFVLLSRGFDTNVAAFRDKLSLKGDSLSAVIEELPEEYRAEYRGLFVRLKAKLDEVKTLNEKCQALTEERLSNIDKSIRKLDKSGAAPYAKPGERKSSAPGDSHILHKSI